MSALDELRDLIMAKGRRLLVAEHAVDLRSLKGNNSIFIMQLPEGSSSAGGRAAGFGERKIEKIYAFRYEDGSCVKLFETDDQDKIAAFEPPYHAASLPVILPSGEERFLSGVIDPDLIDSYVGLLKTH